MTERARRITREVRKHDRLLFCDNYPDRPDLLCVFRKLERFTAYEIDEETTIIAPRPDNHYVFALTDTWSMGGNPVDRGLEPIMARLKEMDLHNSETVVDRLMKSYEKEQETKDRDLRNKHESFLLDFRRGFAKMTDGINTSTLDKTYDRRRKDDGSCK